MKPIHLQREREMEKQIERDGKRVNFNDSRLIRIRFYIENCLPPSPLLPLSYLCLPIKAPIDFMHMHAHISKYVLAHTHTQT